MASLEKEVEGEHPSGCQQKQTLEEDALQVTRPSICTGVAAIKSQYVVINSISFNVCPPDVIHVMNETR